MARSGRRGLSTDALRLMYGVQAMRTFPEDAESIAAAFGIADTLATLRAAREQEPQSYVYLLDAKTPAGRYFKIGKSVTPHRRLSALRTGQAANMPPAWEGHPLTALALRLGGLSVESAIHTDLREHRIPRTEWFTATPDVAAYVVGQGVWNRWDGSAPDPAHFIPAPDVSTIAQRIDGSHTLE